MAGLAGMDEMRRRAGGGEGRGDLAADMAALAHAGDDDAAVGASRMPTAAANAVAELAVQRLAEGRESLCLGLHGAARRLDPRLRCQGVVGGRYRHRPHSSPTDRAALLTRGRRGLHPAAAPRVAGGGPALAPASGKTPLTEPVLGSLTILEPAACATHPFCLSCLAALGALAVACGSPQAQDARGQNASGRTRLSRPPRAWCGRHRTRRGCGGRSTPLRAPRRRPPPSLRAPPAPARPAVSPEGPRPPRNGRGAAAHPGRPAGAAEMAPEPARL